MIARQIIAARRDDRGLIDDSVATVHSRSMNCEPAEEHVLGAAVNAEEERDAIQSSGLPAADLSRVSTRTGME